MSRVDDSPAAQPEAGEQNTVVVPDLGHFGDHLSDRGRIADEVVITDADVTVQPNQIQPVMPDHRCHCDIRLGAVESEAARCGAGHRPHVHTRIRHPDDDVLPLCDNRSQNLDVLNRGGHDVAETEAGGRPELRLVQPIGEDGDVRERNTRRDHARNVGS